MGRQRRLRARSLHLIVAGGGSACRCRRRARGRGDLDRPSAARGGPGAALRHLLPERLDVRPGRRRQHGCQLNQPLRRCRRLVGRQPRWRRPPKPERDKGRFLPLDPALRRRQLRRASPHIDRSDWRRRKLEHRRPQPQRSEHALLRSLLSVTVVLCRLGGRSQDRHLDQSHWRRIGLDGDPAPGPTRTARNLLSLHGILRGRW